MGNFGQRERPEVKAAEFAYLHAHTHTHKRAQIHKRSVVVLHESTSLKKDCLETHRESSLVESEWSVNSGNGQ